MSFTLTGRIYSGTPTQQKTEKFSTRTFVLEVSESANGQTYTNYVQFQLVNNNCPQLDQFRPGDMVTVSFNVRGSLWSDPQGQQKCITNLNAWKLEAAQVSTQAPAPQQPAWGAQPAQPTPAAAPQPATTWGAQQPAQSWGTQSAQQPAWGQPQQPGNQMPF